MKRQGKVVSKKFRNRWIQKLLPIGSVAAVVFGIVLAPRLMGTSDPGRAAMYGLGIGLVASVLLFLVLRIWDRRVSG